jgi:hypothetical protein
MRFGFAAAGLLLLASAAAAAVAAAPDPVSVLIVGTFHMGNPGQDLHNLAADDMLAPKRQAELGAVAAGLKRFRPTRVAVEFPAALTTERYAAFRGGTLAPSRNEVVQLGFRLAQASNLETVDGIDVEGEFPYDAVDAYAKQHGQSPIVEAAGAEVQTFVDDTGKRLATGGVSGVLRFLNDPVRLAAGNAFYRTMLRIGGADAQPGADLLTAWYRRNFLICARLIQTTRPGDRVVVFYGSGHAFLLRQCVVETPGLQLVEANDYLPQP